MTSAGVGWRGNERMEAESKIFMQRWLLAMPFAIFISFIHQMPGHASPKVFRVKMPPTAHAGIVVNKIWYYFDNSRNMDGCIMVGRGCYKSSGLKVEYINQNHVRIEGTKPFHGCAGVPFEYGECTARGWKRSDFQP